MPLSDQYHEAIQDNLNQDIVEHVETTVSDNPTHYLPHRDVIIVIPMLLVASSQLNSQA